MWFSVRKMPLDSWVKGGYVNVLFTYGELDCGFKGI